MYFDKENDKYSQGTLNFDYLNASVNQCETNKNAFEIKIKGITKGESFVFRIKDKSGKDKGSINEWVLAI